MFAKTISERPSTAPPVYTGNDQTGKPTTSGYPDSKGSLVKVEETLEVALDVEKSGTESLEKGIERLLMIF